MTLLLAAALVAAQDWPEFRGPDGQGRSAAAKLPLTWGEAAKNVAWRTPVDGLGWSSPVVAGGRVWLTTATEEGRSLRAVAIDASTGKVLVNVEIFRRDAPGGIHRKNSHASPTPVLDGDRVYVHFGASGTACLDTEGKVLWRKTIPYEPVHGSGGSPALVGEALIFSCDGTDLQAVIALDRRTGAERWRSPRPALETGKKFAFCTPLAIDVAGKPQVVCPGAGVVTSHDPATGRIVWSASLGSGYSVVPRPVSGHGLVYLSTGFDRATLMAIRADGKGDVTATHVAWRLEKGAPHSPSPLLVGEELYVVSDAGVATCVDAKSGRVHWQERLGGAFSASPVAAAGRIYFLSEDGATTVLKVGTSFEKLARNELKSRTFASPAPVEGALFLRTEKHLLRINAEE